MFYDFSITTYGKWILAGEHAVLRGHGALVFPIKERQLILTYRASSQSLGAEYAGASGSEMHLLFWSVLEQGLQLLGRSLNQLQGYFHLDSSIPVGVGMGASAALCVAMSSWFCAQKMVDTDRCFEFAKELEHLFHGKSSGLDIAGVASNTGTYFEQGTCLPLKPLIQPKWFLSSCNQVGITSHCIQQVQFLWDNDPQLAKKIDQQMAASVRACREALESGSPDAISALAEAMSKACDCFVQWGLVSERLQQHMNYLLQAGAIAVKPTGSGGGGFVLSLWNERPTKQDMDWITV